jgi:hypothetical protein
VSLKRRWAIPLPLGLCNDEMSNVQLLCPDPLDVLAMQQDDLTLLVESVVSVLEPLLADAMPHAGVSPQFRGRAGLKRY